MDRFTAAYVECLVWSSRDDQGEPFTSKPYGSEDIAPEAMAQIVADCTTFQVVNHILLTQWDDDTQAGHDFCLTRNRHGAGYWDRGRGALGEALTEASHAYGSMDLYVGDDDKLYIGES